MRFRTYKSTDLTVSEVGFGLWTLSTGWWGNFTEGEAIALMQKAFDLGITLYDAADTYGNGLSEELIAKAFPKRRDDRGWLAEVWRDHRGSFRNRVQRRPQPRLHRRARLRHLSGHKFSRGAAGQQHHQSATDDPDLESASA
jgi:hypothetical protein